MRVMRRMCGEGKVTRTLETDGGGVERAFGREEGGIVMV